MRLLYSYRFCYEFCVCVCVRVGYICYFHVSKSGTRRRCRLVGTYSDEVKYFLFSRRAGKYVTVTTQAEFSAVLN